MSLRAGSQMCTKPKVAYLSPDRASAPSYSRCRIYPVLNHAPHSQAVSLALCWDQPYVKTHCGKGGCHAKGLKFWQQEVLSALLTWRCKTLEGLYCAAVSSAIAKPCFSAPLQCSSTQVAWAMANATEQKSACVCVQMRLQNRRSRLLMTTRGTKTAGQKWCLHKMPLLSSSDSVWQTGRELQCLLDPLLAVVDVQPNIQLPKCRLLKGSNGRHGPVLVPKQHSATKRRGLLGLKASGASLEAAKLTLQEETVSAG